MPQAKGKDMWKTDASKIIAASINPNHRDFVAALSGSHVVPAIGDEVYPFLGTSTLLKVDPFEPTAVVLGPSKPISGDRLPVLPPGDECVNLSAELADYNWKRTASIMKGAKAGC